MKVTGKSAGFLCIFLFMIFLNGCSVFKSGGENLGDGLMSSVKSNVDTVGFEAVKGFRESLTSDESRERIDQFLDSLVNNFGSNTNRQLIGIRDSLLNDYITLWLQDELLGTRTSERLVSIRNSFFDSYLQEYLTGITSGLGNNILNDSTLLRISALRDTILGNGSNRLISAIVDTAMITLASRIDSDINPLLKENLTFIEKNATWILILIGIITLVIIWFVWQKKEKYLKMTKVLSYQISEVKDENMKENLKNNISKNAKTIGLEDDLRVFLDKQGLLHLDKK